MKKTVFTNTPFYYLLNSYIIALLLYNLYVIATGNLYGIIPITIQAVMLFLIFTRNEYARIVMLIWAVGVLLIATVFQIVGDLLDTGFDAIQSFSFLFNLIQLIVAIIIVDYIRRTVFVRTQIISENGDIFLE